MEHIELAKSDIEKVRGVDGFPNGSYESIRSLSNAPSYAACPNPFIGDFVKGASEPYQEDSDKYKREPFAADVSEGKKDPVYNAHSYHTKVPYKAIMRYLVHYTKPGDVVFDGFCGTGMTGVAAQMCGSEDRSLEFEMTGEFESSKWGKRYAVISDLSPAATFIADVYNTPVKVAMHLGGSSYYTFSALTDFPFLFPFEYKLAKEAILQDEDFVTTNFGGELSVSLKS